MRNDLLESIYLRYSKEIRLYLYVISKNETLADDLTQETFLKALLSLPEDHPNVRAWLYTVARNLYYNKRKKERKADRIGRIPGPGRRRSSAAGGNAARKRAGPGAAARGDGTGRKKVRDRAAALLFGRAAEGRRGAHGADAGKRAGAAVPGKKRTENETGGVGI